MVGLRDALQFAAGFCAAIFILSIYAAFRGLYLPLFGTTVGPAFFWSSVIASFLLAAVCSWFGMDKE